MNFKKMNQFALLALTLGSMLPRGAAAGTLTSKSQSRVQTGSNAAHAYSVARAEQDLPAVDAQQGIPSAPPPTAAEHAAVTVPTESQPAEVEVTDIYAPDPTRKKSRFKLARSDGDTDVLLLPSARPLNEGQVHVALDEFLLWRGEMGVTDEFSLEASSVWALTAEISGKYAFVRENNTAVSLRVGAGAATVQKQLNWSFAQLLYTKDFPRGAVHLGAHLVFVHTPNDGGFLVPQGTVGGEVKLIKYVWAIAEAGLGNDLLQATGFENNTGFVNLGARLAAQGGYVTAGLVMPTNSSFLNSAALGIPFLRFGVTF